MIELIPGLPDDTVGFSAKGTVTAEDYETVLMPAVEDVLSRHKKMRVLYHLGEEFEGVDLGAMWDDTKIGLKHPLSWHRVAVVTDTGWVRKLSLGFGLFLFGHLKVFPNSELAQATAWLTEESAAHPRT